MTTTPLFDIHESLGGRFTDFAGWQMPLRYGSAVDEHHAVRNAAGLFDLTHMAEIEVAGAGAAEALDYAFIGNLGSLKLGRARYTMMCNEAGFIVDDLVVYRRDEDRYLVVANASNGSVVAAGLTQRASGFDCTVADTSLDVALIAIQGPHSEAIVCELTEAAAADVKYYAGIDSTFAGGPVFVARTGYTGEDGFEIYLPPDRAVEFWQAATAVGEPHGLVPAGLAARDSLRLEAGMALYGNELDLTTTPFDAGAGRMIKFDKPGDFVGRAALEAAADAPHHSLVGLLAEGKRPARGGYPVLDDDGATIGTVTSGTLSPTLGHPVAIARLDPGIDADTGVHIDIRGAVTPAAVVSLPFYKRASPIS